MTQKILTKDDEIELNVSNFHFCLRIESWTDKCDRDQFILLLFISVIQMKLQIQITWFRFSFWWHMFSYHKSVIKEVYRLP